MNSHEFISELLDFVFVPRCFACGEIVVRTASTLGAARCFCPLCQEAIVPLESPMCSICAEPFAEGGSDHRCSTCLRHPPPFDRVIAPFEYGGPLARAILKFKYTPSPYMARELARLLPRERLTEFDVVIPVPLHPRRLVQRGFNQAALLAGHLAREARLPLCVDILQRERLREAQMGKSAKERIRNMKDAFQLCDRHHRLKGRRVLLLDDVVTTTATVRSAAAMLRRQGRVAGVQVMCLGRAAIHS